MSMGDGFDLDRIGGTKALRSLIDEVLACGEDAQRLFRDGVAKRAIRKPDTSPVTEADLALEKRLRGYVARHFPDAAFLGEESGASGEAKAEIRFVVDPIDGTRAFVRGIPTWSVLVGIEYQDTPVAGIALMPAAGDLFVGVVGDGATMNGRPLHLSRIESLDEATVCHAMLGHFLEAGAMHLVQRLAEGTYTQRGVHDFDGFRQVLDGRAEAMVDAGASPWDLCAAAAILEAAGGRLTAIDGTPSIYNKGGLASNGLVHDALVTLLAGGEQDAPA
jgi:fructose-1,6-bisphosphatase/inositol monophosphatase family enzyme